MAEEQRSILITGTARGIGRAVVELFAGAGWQVIGLDRDPYEGEFPESGLFIQADVASASELEEAFAQVSKSAGSLDALVNNAALQIAKPILETTPEEWDRLMDVNLRAAFLVIKHAHPLLKKASGAIVNVSSIHAVATSADIAAYAASKGGLLAFTRALAIEFAPDNIRVNAVLPGAVDTPMLRAGLSRGHVQGSTVEERLAGLASRTVIGRVGAAEEVARAVLFLADNEQSSFITGQSLIVDGGASARLSTE
jgi:NAD(P)-dependent dehydrogenase (short-subunit alcohol dehydrogenase family)